MFDQDFDKDDMHIYARQAARIQALHEVGVRLFGDDAYHAALSEHIACKRHKRLAEWSATGKEYIANYWSETNESSRREE